MPAMHYRVEIQRQAGRKLAEPIAGALEGLGLGHGPGQREAQGLGGFSLLVGWFIGSFPISSILANLEGRPQGVFQ